MIHRDSLKKEEDIHKSVLLKLEWVPLTVKNKEFYNIILKKVKRSGHDRRQKTL